MHILPQAPLWLGMVLGLPWDMEFVTPMPGNVMFWAK